MRFSIALLFSFSSLILSGPAIADGDKVLICPDGETCIVHTCSADTCTVFYCGNGTCEPVTSYPNPDSGGGSESTSSGVTSEARESRSLEPLKGDQVVPIYGAPGLSCGTQRCVIKTCNELECTLFGFERGRSVSLGSFDNDASLIERIAEDFRNSGQGSDKQR